MVTLYHLTKRSHLPSIKVKGLIPHNSSQWEPHQHYSDRVCLFCDLDHSLWHTIRILANKELIGTKEIHENWTEDDWQKFFHSLVLLQVTTDVQCYEDTLAQWEGIDAVYVTSGIDASHIQEMDVDIADAFTRLCGCG